MNRPALAIVAAMLCPPAFSQTGDAPAVDVAQIVEALKQFRQQNEAGLKARRASAYQQVAAAAASNERAAAYWTEAVLAVQFAGVDHQGAAVRDWKQGEGEGLRSKEGANAARLHLVWLGLTLQRASNVEVRQLLNNIIDYTRQVQADEAANDRTRERGPAGKRPAGGKAASDDSHARRAHDSLMRMSVAASPVARWLQIADLLGDVAPKKTKGGGADASGWEMVPGNVNGIYNSIILPELRASKDPRLLDYWDMVLRREGEAIYPGMPDFEERQWTQVRRPGLLWSRAQDVLALGQRNRAISDMFNIIKTHPQHPDVAGWVSQLESVLVPPHARQPSMPTAPNDGGAVLSPPAPIPPATVPTATIVPPPAGGTPQGAQPAPR